LVRQAEIERAKRKRPDNLDAYDLYLRALEQSYRFTQEGRAAGLALLEAALALDPDYAAAHAVAAFCRQQRFLWGGRDPADRAAALAHAEAVAAARSDDATTLAFAALAMSALARRHDMALAMVERALAQTPSSAIAHTVMALVDMMLGRPEEAVRHAERAVRLSPLDPLRHMPEAILGAAKLATGDAKTALRHINKAREANPLFAPNHTTLALCLVRLGRLNEARAAVQQLLEIAPDTRLANLEERYLFANALGFARIAAELRSAGMPE
jgi:adenylate cyclase